MTRVVAFAAAALEPADDDRSVLTYSV